MKIAYCVQLCSVRVVGFDIVEFIGNILVVSIVSNNMWKGYTKTKICLWS